LQVPADLLQRQDLLAVAGRIDPGGSEGVPAFWPVQLDVDREQLGLGQRRQEEQGQVDAGALPLLDGHGRKLQTLFAGGDVVSQLKLVEQVLVRHEVGVEGLDGGGQHLRVAVLGRGGEAPVVVMGQDAEFVRGLGHQVVDEGVAFDHEARDLEVVLPVVDPDGEGVGHGAPPAVENLKRFVWRAGRASVPRLVDRPPVSTPEGNRRPFHHRRRGIASLRSRGRDAGGGAVSLDTCPAL
jgi:hypothetical protein